MQRISSIALTLPLLLASAPVWAQSWGNSSMSAQVWGSYLTPEEKSLETSTRSIVVEPDLLQVDLQLDRSGSNPIYRPEESISFTVNTTQDA